MTVGEKIRTRRKQLGMTVDELAARLGKNRATIYRYESDAIVKRRSILSSLLLQRSARESASTWRSVSSRTGWGGS